MASASSRAFLLFIILAFIGLLAITSPGFKGARLAHANLIGQFTTQAPEKLHVGDQSHGIGVLADADPAEGGTVGYCINPLNIAGLSPVGGSNGFTAENGIVTSSDVFTAGTISSSDDIYCATVEAGTDVDPETGFGSMTLIWNYTDGTQNYELKLEIELFEVRLIPVDGAIDGSAQVCTMNWDPEILAGFVANSAGELPDPVDDVRLYDDIPPDEITDPDWVIDDTNATWPGAVGTIEKLGQFRQAPLGLEWCMTFSADEQVENLEVSLWFDAVYNINTNSDDQPHTPTAIVSVLPFPPELRHVTPGGQLTAAQDSNENVIGMRHYVCIVPSDEDDILDPDDINFTGNGPTVTDLQIFYDGVTPNRPNFPGVVDGTLCLSWVSTAPGEQFLDLTLTVDGDPDQRVFVSWDRNDDNNDNDPETGAPENTALIKQWNVIDFTEIGLGNDPEDEDSFVTFTRQERNLLFNIGDGTFFAGDISLSEFVFGSHTGATGRIEALLDGVILEARIIGECGYFLVDGVDPKLEKPTVLTGTSVLGRFDVAGGNTPLVGADLADGLYDNLTITITNDPNCGPSSILRLEIEATYPGPIGSGTNVSAGVEWVEFEFSYTPAFKTPRVAWAGTTVTTVFALGGNCDPFLGQTVYFTRSDGQSGTFVPGPGVLVTGADGAQGQLDPDTCSLAVDYHSEEPGEVDILITFSDNPWAMVAHPLFFLALEDVTATSSPELIVSERGDLSAAVSGWFVGNNPSGNPARTTEDGRALPLDRWVLPDDWDRLRGSSEFRPNWANSAPMPLLNVTFFMENEGVVNDFKTGVSEGAAGFFLLDGSESSLNVNPFTGASSKLGSVGQPRIITDLTDNDGLATVDLFGDLNLSYEGCDVNLPTGNPHCGIDDLVGVTRYYAVAEYPHDRGKYPPATSNITETEFFWAGYKEVSVQDTGLPFQKYIVAHLKDRDGFCDALGYNNTLGTPVRFLLDSGTGVIIQAEGPPSIIAVDGRDATATTYDTLDNAGNEINLELVKTVLFEDECQAWIRVSSSLLKPLNIITIFDAPPSEVPAEVRITNLQCSAETVTVTNMDDHPVSLAGFALRSRGSSIEEPEEHLDLIGLLQPGESKTFLGGDENGWLFSGPSTFDNDADYARLVWNEFELSRRTCAGGNFQPPVPAPLPKDGEGEIWIDTIVEFGDVSEIPLSRGWNLLTHTGDPVNVGEAFGGREAHVGAVYAWNPDTGKWDRHFMSAPAFASTFQQFQPGVVYWVEVKDPFTLYVGE